MTSNWQPAEPTEPGPEPEWRQPPFSPGGQPASAAYRADSPAPYPVVQGAVVVPASAAVPPSAAETALRVTARVLPVLLVLGAILGPVPWWIAIVGLLVGSSVLNQVARDMKRRRIAAAGEQRILPPADEPR